MVWGPWNQPGGPGLGFGYDLLRPPFIFDRFGRTQELEIRVGKANILTESKQSDRRGFFVLLVKVIPDELAACEVLEYNLYSMNGDLLWAAGAVLNEDDWLQLGVQSLYRDVNALPRLDLMDSVNHEGHVFTFATGTSQAEQAAMAAERDAAALLTGENAGICVSAIQHFWDRLKRGAAPDIALCEVARDRLIAEITTKVDQIQYISQVRVRDDFTYSHILDVTALSIALAIKAGFSKEEVREVALAAILHDMGKLLIPRDIMFKPGRLTEKEFQVMQLHPGLGYKINREVLKLPDPIARPALEHQEMFGGGGYPNGLKGDEIHPYSHLVKIADVYDALTSKRPYKESIPSFKAIQIMLSEGDKSFHPVYLEHFIKLSNYHDFSRGEVSVRREIAS
jgi:HD-GYP domain-containing protein (c-di-GMP phosphodiesterase class II)